MPAVGAGSPLDLDSFFDRQHVMVGGLVDGLVKAYVAVPIDSSQRADLVRLLGKDDAEPVRTGLAARGGRKQFLRAMLMLPEFQLQ